MKNILLTFLVFIFFTSACNKDNEEVCESFLYNFPVQYDIALTPMDGTIIYSNNVAVLEMTDFDTTSIRVLYEIQEGLTPWPVISHNGTRVGINDRYDGVIGTYEFDINDGSDLQLILTPEGDLSEGIIGWHDETGYLCVIKNIDNDNEIYTMTDSLDLKNYSNHKSWDNFPVADAEGNIYWFSLRENNGNEQREFCALYKVDKNGNNLEKIRDIQELQSKDFGCKHNGNFPALSPNNQTLVFNMDRDLYSIDLVTKELFNITNTNSAYEAAPFFHPNMPDRVFFSLVESEENGGFYSIKTDGTEIQRHTKGVHRWGKFKE